MEYEQLSESKESLLPGEGPPARWNTPRSSRSAWVKASICLNCFLLLVSVALLVDRQHEFIPRKPNSWLRQTSYYSPLWGTSLESNLRKEDHLMDGSLFETTNPSRYRNGLSPSDDVEKAWQEIEWIRTFPITAEDVRRIGKDPELVAKFPIEYGFGDDAYVAQLDIFHQLHCLNLLRHVAWGEFDRDGKTAKRPYSDLHWIHVAHCTEVLRENLMCSANLDIITFNWKETQDLPFADFNVNKKCTNTAVIMEWQQKNTIETERARNFTRPAGAKEVPISDEYFRIFGVERVDLHPGEAHEHSYKGTS